jgi:heat shock protein HslJ
MRRAVKSAIEVAASAILVGVFVASAAAIAAERSFPYDSELLLEAKPMKGSKRVPILEIEPDGKARIGLWCNDVQARLVVVEETITVIMGEATRQQCEPERTQADADLVAALEQVTGWEREDDLLVLKGERTLRFRQSTH